ncbi:MAG: AMP-binding protein [Bacteroidetes bacterium]|nr:AMP-binding protein [Bacteroidota bacterium]
MDIDSNLTQTMREHPHQVAIEFEGRQITFNELHKSRNSFACFLRSKQIIKGDRVALFTPSSISLVISFLGILRNGSIVIPVNPQFREHELLHMLSDSGAKAVVTDSEHAAFIDAIKSQLPCLKEIILIEELKDMDAWHQVAQESREKLEADDRVAIFYTSGTTGKPKGAALSHRNIITNLDALEKIWEWTERDVLLHTLPLYHVHGLLIALLGSLLVGNKIILRKKFEAADALYTISEKHITLFMGVPTMYFRMAECGIVSDLSSMRLFISGSAPLTKDLFQRFRQRFGFEILERAGMTETLMNFSNTINGNRIPGSVGFPLPGVEVKILDDELQECSPGESGEIAVRGPNVFSGYWQNAEATARSFYDGWFLTGDIGKVDDEGRVFIHSRKKDVIKSGGILIFPHEVEEVIESMPQVKECAVIGIPDDEFGEVIKACVVLNDEATSPEQIMNHCKKHLASYKKPRQVEFFPVLPKNHMGKILKEELRRQSVIS